MNALSPTQRYYRAHRAEVLMRRRISQQLATVDKDRARDEVTAVTLRLADIAALIPMPLSTLRTNWRAMVKDGRLPQPLKGWKQPHFPREETAAFLAGKRAEKARTAVPRRAQAAASTIRNLMQTGETNHG